MLVVGHSVARLQARDHLPPRAAGLLQGFKEQHNVLNHILRECGVWHQSKDTVIDELTEILSKAGLVGGEVMPDLNSVSKADVLSAIEESLSGSTWKTILKWCS